MTGISKQLTKKRWSISIDNEIVAYINCPETCRKITASLEKYQSRGYNLSINIVEKK